MLCCQQSHSVNEDIEMTHTLCLEKGRDCSVLVEHKEVRQAERHKEQVAV